MAKKTKEEIRQEQLADEAESEYFRKRYQEDLERAEEYASYRYEQQYGYHYYD